MTLINNIASEPHHYETTSSSVDSLVISSPFKSPEKVVLDLPERWDKATMVRETVKTYTQKLPAPNKMKGPSQQKSEDEVAEEIMELKKALNTAKHDLQIAKVKNRRYENTVVRNKKKLGRVLYYLQLS